MHCLYCDEEIENESIYSLLIEKDKLCQKCRNSMKYHHEIFKFNDLEIESFYDYNSLFKDILLQYKECNDEALKDVFLYKIQDYLKLKYFGYKIVYVPSSTLKIEDRGFNHLKLIFEKLNLKEAKGLKMKEDINQVGKNLLERKKMINNYIYEGGEVDKVLIVDDMFTTGSSLLGVYLALKPKCKKIRAVILGKNVKMLKK